MIASMARSFDIVEAIGNGYLATWRERRWLARLAFVPVVAKIVGLQIILLLGLERNFLGQAIVLLPAFVAEGWLVVRYVRLLALGERWPDHQNAPGFRPDPRPVLAGILAYTLMQFVLRGLVALAMVGAAAGQGADMAQTSQPDPVAFALAGGMLLVVIWSFRYLWLYILASLGIGLREFLSAIRGFPASFAMIGTWIVCFLPFMMALGVVAGLVLSPWRAGGEVPILVDGGMAALQAVLDTTISLVSTAAMTYGIRQIFGAPKP
ncbi:MAG TPA: hypothetical protein PKX87_00010 [Alphaproteobacteria bacterium]|nr:hypothetical protein [Alphaproteobacteria bacterium]